MSKLKKCLSKIKGVFSKQEEALMYSTEEKYAKEGEVQAATKAILNMHSRLNTELNKLKAQAGLKPSEHVIPITKQAEKEVNDKYDALEKEEQEKAKKEAVDAAEKEAKEKKIKEEKVAKEKKEAEKKVIDVGEEVKATPIEISDSDRGFLIDKGYDNVEINRAEKEANRILGLPVLEMFKELQKKGIFNLGRGEKMDGRPDLGLDKTNYNNTLRQLEQGKTTVTVKKLIDFLNQIKKDGTIPMVFDTGGMAEHNNIPLVFQILGEGSGQEVGLSEEQEKEELEKEQAREKVFAETGDFQKKSESKGDYKKVLDRIQKVMPKVKVVIDEKLNAAGKVQGNTLTINPNYAGLDTPIHEAGHILIDAIGYNNKVIQSAIKQLKTSPLWAEKLKDKDYSKLSEELFAKEVLAEAIGREGAGIFDKQVDKNKFKVFLEYIYNKLKQLLGIDKNIAKSLAKQIIGGIGTKELTGTTEQAQFAKKKSDNEILEELTELVELLKERSVEEIPYEELSALYSAISNAMANKDITGAKGERLLSTVKKRMALNLKSRSTENDRKATEQQIKYKDISWYDKFFKVLSHFGDAFPDMKYLSSLYDSAFLKKVKEAEQYKHTHAKLAKDVVTEKHKQLGIAGRVKEFISNPILNLTTDQKHKYFKFLDNNGKVITADEAKKKGYSEAQIKYVEFVREIMAKAMNIKSSESYNADMDIIKLNKGLGETFQTEGLISGIAAMMTADKFNNIRIKFTNPVTGKDQVAEFKTVKSIISNYGKSGGLAEKAKAAKALVKYTSEVNRQFKKEQHYDGGRENWPKNAKFQPRLDPSGKIPSRFGEERGKGSATYTTDFYSVVNELIDDYTHVKNMSDLVPIVSSLEYLASKGLTKDDDAHKKNNLAKWFELWEKQHLFRVPDENSKGVDYALRKIRWLTSATRMMFNMSAQVMNIITGQLGNIFDMPIKDYLTGVKRMTTNYKYTLDLIDKYHGIEIDKTSNPLRSGMGFISDIGFAGLKWGEIFNQGIGIAGRLTEEEYNAFKYEKNDYKVDELVVKDKDKEAKLEKTIQGYIKEVSDIHGKYGEKDKRNVMNNQWGQAVMQFRVWLPDWLRVRFGDQGRYSRYWQGAISEMKESVRKNGVKQTFWNDKKFMSALKELAVIGFTLSMVYQDDDDDDKSLMAAVYQRTLSELLAVFDFDSAKFTITHPVAAIGTVEKVIDMADHLIAVEADDFYKGKSTWGDKGDSKVRGDVMNFVPGKTAIKYVVDESEDE